MTRKPRSEEKGENRPSIGRRTGALFLLLAVPAVATAGPYDHPRFSCGPFKVYRGETAWLALEFLPSAPTVTLQSPDGKTRPVDLARAKTSGSQTNLELPSSLFTAEGRYLFSVKAGTAALRECQITFADKDVNDPAGRWTREQQEVLVDGVKETWKLQWPSKPVEQCMPLALDRLGYNYDEAPGGWGSPFNCGCDGATYGETDRRLFLVRERNGQVIDELEIPDLGEDGDWNAARGAPVLRTWPRQDGDFERYPKTAQAKFREEILARPRIKTMALADYNHDGWAAEFVVHNGWQGVCGWHSFTVVGIDKNNKKLHPFSTVTNPDRPIIMRSPDGWETLLNGKAGADIPVRIGGCDHGGENYTEYVLRTNADGIHGQNVKRSCETGKEVGRESL